MPPSPLNIFSAPRIAGLFAILLIGSAALAQPWPIVQQNQNGADLLGRSLLNQPLDFRAPSGFEQVYDLGDGRLARIDGGLIAVFPRSNYTASSGGSAMPAGTTYYIGTPPGLNLPSPFHAPTARSAASTFAGNLITRPAARPIPAAGLAPLTRPSPPTLMAAIPSHIRVPPTSTMFTDDAERRRIVESLIERARDANRSP